MRYPINYINHEERIEFLAMETMMGTFGDADNRKRALGKMYYPVQRRVNEIAQAKENYHNSRRGK